MATVATSAMLSSNASLSGMPLERLLAVARLENEKHKESLKTANHMRHVVCAEAFLWLRDNAYAHKCRRIGPAAARVLLERRALRALLHFCQRRALSLSLRTRSAEGRRAAA